MKYLSAFTFMFICFLGCENPQGKQDYPIKEEVQTVSAASMFAPMLTEEKSENAKIETYIFTLKEEHFNAPFAWRSPVIESTTLPFPAMTKEIVRAGTVIVQNEMSGVDNGWYDISWRDMTYGYDVGEFHLLLFREAGEEPQAKHWYGERIKIIVIHP